MHPTIEFSVDEIGWSRLEARMKDGRCSAKYSIPRLLGIGGERNGRLHITHGVFKFPVSIVFGVAGQVVARRDVGANNFA